MSMKGRVTLSGGGGPTDLPLSFPAAAVLLRFHVGLRHTACKYYTEGIHYKGLTARLSNSHFSDFTVPLSDGKLDFYPVILNGTVICFCALN